MKNFWFGLGLFIASVSWAQSLQLRTVEKLPACTASSTSFLIAVSDPLDSLDCTAGGGSAETVICFCDPSVPGYAAVAGANLIDGCLNIRQDGGTPGVDEIELCHTGTEATVESFDGPFRIFAFNGSHGWFDFTASGGFGPELILNDVTDATPWSVINFKTIDALDATHVWRVGVSGQAAQYGGIFEIESSGTGGRPFQAEPSDGTWTYGMYINTAGKIGLASVPDSGYQLKIGGDTLVDGSLVIGSPGDATWEYVRIDVELTPPSTADCSIAQHRGRFIAADGAGQRVSYTCLLNASSVLAWHSIPLIEVGAPENYVASGYVAGGYVA